MQRTCALVGVKGKFGQEPVHRRAAVLDRDAGGVALAMPAPAQDAHLEGQDFVEGQAAARPVGAGQIRRIVGVADGLAQACQPGARQGVLGQRFGDTAQE